MSLSAYQKEFLTKLIAIPSVSGTPAETDAQPGTPYGANPKAALDFFLDEARKAGFTTGVLDNRVGFCEIGSGDRLIGIICHLDVVPAGDGWNSDPFTLTFKNGAMYGRGIIDDKGPAAASFFAMKELLEEGLPDCRIRLILGTDEERTCSCVEYYDANGEIPDISITPDAEFPVIFAEKGILHVKIFSSASLPDGFTAKGGEAANMVCPKTVASFIDNNGQIKDVISEGKNAHASKPELGINSIDLLPGRLADAGFDISSVPLLKFIETFDGSKLCDITDDSGSLTSNSGILRISKEEQYLITDIRYPVTADLDQIMANIKAQASRFGLEVEIDSHMDPIYKDSSSEEITKLSGVWAKHMDRFSGFKEEYRSLYSEPLAIGGGTYARHMRNTVAFGVQTPWQEDQCHQTDEHILIDDFLECVSVIKEAIITLC